MIKPLPESDTANLVVSNHVLYQHKVVDGFGHVSMRDPRTPNLFWMSRSIAPALVRAKDILPFDLDSNPMVRDPPTVYAERFIHGEIYRRSPRAMAVVHSHAESIIPFGVVKGTPLRALFHMASFLGSHTPIFEIRDLGGDFTDLLIRDSKLGAALAQTLGDHSVVLMRGHGATIVGNSLQQAVFRAIYAAQNAALQSQAMILGGTVNYLLAGEVDAATRSIDTFINRAWELWVRDARKLAD
jgi:HCOMODA/2-hydroxy-3-carboxy-muconic semialdehyde decarboxylase